MVVVVVMMMVMLVVVMMLMPLHHGHHKSCGVRVFPIRRLWCVFALCSGPQPLAVAVLQWVLGVCVKLRLVLLGQVIHVLPAVMPVTLTGPHRGGPASFRCPFGGSGGVEGARGAVIANELRTALLGVRVRLVGARAALRVRWTG